MRRDQSFEHQQVLMLAEPLAQALRFVDPHARIARPQRLDRLHLVAVGDDALAQFMQVFAVGTSPVGRQIAPRRAKAAREPLRHVGESQRVDRPMLDRTAGVIQHGHQSAPACRR